LSRAATGLYSAAIATRREKAAVAEEPAALADEGVTKASSFRQMDSDLRAIEQIHAGVRSSVKRDHACDPTTAGAVFRPCIYVYSF